MKHLQPIAFVLAACSFAPLAGAQGAGQVFESNSYTWLDENSRMEYPADLNGDGKMEIVGWWSYWSTYSAVQIFFWSQDPVSGMWVEKEETFGSGSSSYQWETATVIGDFDADGKDEMAVLNHWGIEVFEPNASGIPIRIVDQDYVPNISALDRSGAAFDFDADGRDDIVLAAGDKIYLYRSVPGGFQLTDTHVMTGGHLTVVCADAEGDAAMEVVVLQERVVPYVHVFQIQGVQFMNPRPYALQEGVGGAWDDPIKIAPGDVDGDGDTDLVLFGMGAFYQVMRRDASGYVVENPRVGGPATDLVDINNDGNLDGICCGGGGGGNFVYNTAPAMFEICMGDGDGNFDNSVPFPGKGALHVSGAIDFDADGDLDVIAGRAVLINHGEVGGVYCPGAVNSTGSSAEIHVAGRQSAAAGGPTISMTGAPANSISVLLAGTIHSAASISNTPFWDGSLCVTGSLYRLKTSATDGAGAVDFGGASNWEFVAPGVAPNKTYAYQVWYRDGAAANTGANLSSAAHVLIIN